MPCGVILSIPRMSLKILSHGRLLMPYSEYTRGRANCLGRTSRQSSLLRFPILNRFIPMRTILRAIVLNLTLQIEAPRQHFPSLVLARCQRHRARMFAIIIHRQSSFCFFLLSTSTDRLWWMLPTYWNFLPDASSM